MEDALKEALLAAGDLLAEAIRAGLVAHGVPGDLNVGVSDGRVVVSSRAREVFELELGRLGGSPVAAMESAARAAAPRIVDMVAERLRAAL